MTTKISLKIYFTLLFGCLFLLASTTTYASCKNKKLEVNNTTADTINFQMYGTRTKEHRSSSSTLDEEKNYIKVKNADGDYEYTDIDANIGQGGVVTVGKLYGPKGENKFHYAIKITDKNLKTQTCIINGHFKNYSFPVMCTNVKDPLDDSTYVKCGASSTDTPRLSIDTSNSSKIKITIMPSSL